MAWRASDAFFSPVTLIYTGSSGVGRTFVRYDDVSCTITDARHVPRVVDQADQMSPSNNSRHDAETVCMTL